MTELGLTLKGGGVSLLLLPGNQPRAQTTTQKTARQDGAKESPGRVLALAQTLTWAGLQLSESLFLVFLSVL